MVLKQSSFTTFSNINLKKKTVLLIVFLNLIINSQSALDITDNTCTFKVDGNVFSLVYLNKLSSSGYYSSNISNQNGSTVFFNFCDPILPKQCSQFSSEDIKSYSYVKHKNDVNDPVPYSCQRFTSDSKTKYFTPSYKVLKGEITLNLSMSTPLNDFSADFIIDCDQSQNNNFTSISSKIEQNKITIYGKSSSGCPLFQLQSLWKALSDNKVIFGALLLIIGFIMLFYGILMTQLMIFLTAYFLCFAVLTGIFTAFLGIDSSRIAIYFSLLFILFASTIIAYYLTKMVRISVFFIGAFMGFLIGALVNTAFVGMFNVNSIWSLIFFQIIFTVPLGLLTFKYSEQVIVFSTSVVGSYMIVRPFSWIFGGYPNQFTLYQSINSGQVSLIPWQFYVYLTFMFALFVIGFLYQNLKLHRRNNRNIQKNFITENVQQHLDRIHAAVKNVMARYAPQQYPQANQNYKNMQNKQQIQLSTPLGQPQTKKQKQNQF